jgi:hypothetical protein
MFEESAGVVISGFPVNMSLDKDVDEIDDKEDEICDIC